MTSLKISVFAVSALLLLLAGCGGRVGADYVCLDGELASDLADCKQPKHANFSECALSLGLTCASAKLSEDGYLFLKVKNELPGEITVSGLYCTEDKARDVRAVPLTEWTNLNRTIPQGATADLVLVPCRNADGFNQQFDKNQSFAGSAYIKHFFTITPEEERIAVADLDIKAN